MTTLYSGGYGRIHKQCKFQPGNVVYLCRIAAPKRVPLSTLAYQKKIAVVIGYNKWQFGNYTIMFEDGHIAQVLGAMLKKRKDRPEPGGPFDNWESFVKPQEFEFKTPKPDREEEKQRLKQLGRYGFRTTNLIPKKYNLDGLFHKVVSSEVIAQCPYYGAFNKDKYPLDDSVIKMGMDYNCISVLRVVHDVINNGHQIDKRLDYVTVVPGHIPAPPQTSVHIPSSRSRDKICLKPYVGSSMKTVLNRFYTSVHMDEVIGAAARIADPDLGCILDI